MKRICAIAIFLLISMPSTLYAQGGVESSAANPVIETLRAQIAELLRQLEELRAQIGTGTGTGTGGVLVQRCPVINRILRPGSQGSDVRGLQDFLRAEGYFTAESTGNYGSITTRAVQRFQAAQGLVSSGTPLSTG